MKRWFLLFFFSTQILLAQSVYISRYIYGNITNDTYHRLDFFNPSRNPQNLSGYIVVTRNYVFQFPERTIIQPYKTLNMGKGLEKNATNSMDFTKIKDFLVRFSLQKVEGDYVVLLDRERKIVDAVYFSVQNKPRFLPDKAELITFDNEKILLEIPSASHPKWKSINLNPDPAIVMICINDKWQASSKKKNLYPSTEYAKLQGSYVAGIVSLKWHTNFEEDCFLHEIERSKKGDNFIKIGDMEAKINSKTGGDYLFYDEKVEKDKTYYYRIKNTDKFNNVVYSEVVELNTNEMRKEFSICPIQSNQGELAIRFYSQIQQTVKIKILDEQFREIAIIFQGEAGANHQNLIQYTQNIQNGKYFLIADTPKYRFYQDFSVIDGKIEVSGDCINNEQ